ncbi:MAG TPA: polysaccharide pyruvyl transferase family protein [Longimicrobiales bacterium]|nr:polysaccharide pyruvyl transferase family protein [Longimicrobiales bacterium]
MPRAMQLPAERGARRRVTVLNSVALNAGDAAILAGLRVALLEAFGADLELQVADDAPTAASALYPDIDFFTGLHGSGLNARHALRGATRSLHRRRVRIAQLLLERAPAGGRALLDRRGREHLARVGGSVAAISTGGTYFVEHYSFERRALEVLAAISTGVPTFLYTQSLGPFTRRDTRHLMRRVLSGCAAVFLRDERSRQHALELGVDEARLHVRPDAAFVLSVPGPTLSTDRPLRIAVSVREWGHFSSGTRAEGTARYTEAVAATVRALAREQDAQVTFMSTCQGVPAYWTDDSQFADRIVGELLRDVPGVHVDHAFRSPVALRDAYREFDLVIATRMHAAILALCAGTPVVPIAYEFKTMELFRSLGMAELVDDIDHLSPESLVARVKRAVDERYLLRARIAALLPQLREQAAEPAHRIRRLIEVA